MARSGFGARIATTAAAFLLLGSGQAFALPQPQDDWDQQLSELSPNTRFLFDNRAATIQAGEPLTPNDDSWCAQVGFPVRMNRTLWWYVTGTGGRIVLSTVGSAGDPLLTVYDAGATVPPQAGWTCSDDALGIHARVTLESSIAGARYLVQAGHCADIDEDADGDFEKSCASRVTPLALTSLTNDQRDFAEPVGLGKVDRANIGATAESEPTQCNGSGYGASVWFRWTAPHHGAVTVAAASEFSSATALFAAGGGSPLACDIAGDEDELSSGLSHYVSPGEYLIQVGGRDSGGTAAEGSFALDVSFEQDLDVDDDGSRIPDDCNDGEATVRPGVGDMPHNGVDENCDGGDNKDADGDRHDASSAGGDDCDDADPRVHPGARDRPGTRVDEDCSGGAEIAISLGSGAYLGGRRFGVLRIRGLDRGARVLVRCRGSRRCPNTVRRRARGRAMRIRAYVGRYFAPGTRIEVFVTSRRRSVLGLYKSYRVVGRGATRRRTCDLHPTAPRRPVGCRR